MPSTRVVILIVAVVALLALPIPGAAAQGGGAEACKAPRLDLPEPPAPFEPGNARAFTVRAVNPNAVPGQVRLSVPPDSLPAGWSAIVSEQARPIAASGEATFTVTLAAPARGAGAEQGDVQLKATMACQTEPFASQSPATVQTVRVELAVFGLAWLLWGVGLAAAVSLAIVLMVVLGRRRSVALQCDTRSKPVPAGEAASFPLLVENRTPEPLKAHLAIRVHTPGWTGFLAMEEVDLDAGEALDLWASLRPPAGTPLGAEGRATVTLHRAGRSRDRASLVLKAQVGAAVSEASSAAARN